MWGLKSSVPRTDRAREGSFVGQMILQWHVTERCNLRCSHCYQEGNSADEIEFSDLIEILIRFKELIEDRERELGGRVRGHLTLTGGEPFARRDFLELLERVAGCWPWTSFAVLTNGSLIDEALARHLARLQPAFLQVSLDGAEHTHDKIRGSGNFQHVVNAIKNLVAAGVRTMISFTANRENWHEFREVARLGCELKVSRVWADRMLPMGQGSSLGTLSQDETRAFFRVMRQAREEAKKRWFCRTEVAMHRALQFLEGGGTPYHCTAGDALLTIMPNGDLYPCRRMPIKVGNVLETPLADLYYHSDLLLSLRGQEMSRGCESCSFHQRCRGGLRCLSYATTGTPWIADPGCWLQGQSGGGLP